MSTTAAVFEEDASAPVLNNKELVDNNEQILTPGCDLRYGINPTRLRISACRVKFAIGGQPLAAVLKH